MPQLESKADLYIGLLLAVVGIVASGLVRDNISGLIGYILGGLAMLVGFLGAMLIVDYVRSHKKGVQE